MLPASGVWEQAALEIRAVEEQELPSFWIVSHFKINWHSKEEEKRNMLDFLFKKYFKNFFWLLMKTTNSSSFQQLMCGY